jgi:DNA repair exonuclease SbcCD ATPase subunit
MAEGKALGKDDLFEKDVFTNAVTGAKELLSVIRQTQDTIKGSISAQKEFVSTFKAKSYDDVKQLNTAIAETNTLIKQKEQLTKTEIAIQQQAEKLNQEKLRTQREEIKNQQIIEKQNKASERSLNALNGEYSKGVKQLAEIKKQLKELEFTGRSSGKLFKALSQEFEALDKSVRKAETSVGEFQRNVGNYPNAVKELKALNREMQNLEVGSEEFTKAAKKAGALRDQIKDAKEATAVFANESKTAQAGTAFGQMLGSIKDLDFKDAADKAKIFANVVSSISLTEVVSGIKNLGSALLSVGKAFLLNPLGLIVAAIAAIVYVIYDFIDANNQMNAALAENQKAIEENEKSFKKYANAHAEYLVKMAVAMGTLSKAQGELKLAELQSNVERSELAKKFADQKIALAKSLNIDLANLENGRANERYTGDYKQMRANIAFNKGLIDLEKSQALERKGFLQSQQEEINLMKKENDNEEKAKTKEKLEREKKENEEALKRMREHEEALRKQRAEAKRKEFEELSKQVQKDNEDLNKYIEEQEVKKLQNETERKKAAAYLEYQQKIKQINDSKAVEDVRDRAIIAARNKFDLEIASIDKATADKAEADKKARDEKNQAIFDAAEKRKAEIKKLEVENEKKKVAAILAETDKLSSYIQKGLENRNKQVNDALNKETEANKTAIDQQQRLAERGLANTLAFEKAKGAQLELEKKRQQEKEIRQQKIFAFYALFSSYASKSDPATALQKAIVDTALAEVISGSFIEGTENVGRDLQGNKVHNGTDGYVVAVDGRERILNPEQNRQVGALSNDELANIAENYNKGLLFNYGNISSQNTPQIIAPQIELTETNNLLRQLLDKPVHQTNLDNLGNVVYTEIRNGVTKAITHKRRI